MNTGKKLRKSKLARVKISPVLSLESLMFNKATLCHQARICKRKNQDEKIFEKKLDKKIFLLENKHHYFYFFQKS